MKRNKIITLILLLGLFVYLHESENRLKNELEDFSVYTLLEDPTDTLRNTRDYASSSRIHTSQHSQDILKNYL